jgi:predicted nuclease of restriction endonuclease-like RecB superfamily
MSELALLDDTDLPWLAELVDVVVASSGKPWRIALERLDDLGRFELPRAPVRFAAAVSAVQRILGGRARNASRARTARALALGAPVLSPAEREARIAHAASELEVSCAAVENLLWSDLPRERPVELLRGRPREIEVAAFANVYLLQRAMRRAHAVRLSIHGDAGAVIRGATSRGLLMTVSLGGPAADRDSGGPRADDTSSVTHIDIVGPLALFHRTAVYGKALADLVPLLAECERFELTITSRARGSQPPVDREGEPAPHGYRVHARSPIVLPPAPARSAAPRFDLQRLVRELRRIAFDANDHELRVSPCRATFTTRGALLCPDLVIERGSALHTTTAAESTDVRRTYVEVLGFWTREFLERRSDLYTAAGLDDVVFCVDESRGCTKEELPEHVPVIGYAKRTTALAMALYERTRGSP